MSLLRPLFALALLAACAPSASAQYLGSRFSYSYVEVDYLRTQFDLADDSLDGYFANVSIESTKNIRLLARWGDANGTAQGQSAKRRDLELGIGIHQQINRQLDSIFDLKFLRTESDAVGMRSTQVGFGMEGGLRGYVNDYLELNGSLEFRTLIESELGGRAGLLVHFTQNVALGMGLTYFGEQQSVHAGIRFSL